MVTCGTSSVVQKPFYHAIACPNGGAETRGHSCNESTKPIRSHLHTS